MRNLSGIYNEILQSISQEDPRTSSETFQNPFDCDNLGTSPEKKNVLEALYEQRPNVSSTQSYHVLKLTGIPRGTTISDIYEFFEPIKIANGHQPPQFTECVHFVTNPTSRKFEYEVFIEFQTKQMAKEAFDLKSTECYMLDPDCQVKLYSSSQNELQNRLFPGKRVQKNRSEIEDGIIYMTREEILSLLKACRAVKHSSTYSKNRTIHLPFQAVISVLAKVDWSRTKEISTLQRDHLFEMAKLSIEATNLSNWPSYVQKPKELVGIKARLLRAGLCVPLFTEKQKVILLNIAGMPCPKDLIAFVYTPEEESPENEFLKFTYRVRQPSTDSYVGTVSSDYSPSVTAYKKLLYRADRADHVISLLQKDIHEMSLKYQNSVFELDRAEERYRHLKREFDNLNLFLKNSRIGNRENLQEPSPGLDIVRSISANLLESNYTTPTHSSRRLEAFDTQSRLPSRYSSDDRDDSKTFTNQWRKSIG